MGSGGHDFFQPIKHCAKLTSEECAEVDRKRMDFMHSFSAQLLLTIQVHMLAAPHSQ